MIKIIPKNKLEIVNYSAEEFKAVMGVEWLSSVKFENDKIRCDVAKRCLMAIRKRKFDVRHAWLSDYYLKEIESGYSSNLAIYWISEIVGYGVTNIDDIHVNDFVVEYAGIIKKRCKKKDKHNDYCFDYSIGQRRSSYVIDAKYNGNYARFVNHNHKPNLESISVCINNKTYMILIAIKDIKAGSQLHYDYGEGFWKKKKRPAFFLT